MRSHFRFAVVLALTTACIASAKPPRQWVVGKVLDTNRARYFAGTYNSANSTTNQQGSVSGTANSTSIGDSTDTRVNGTYSGTSTSSTSGYSVPIYRVYDNLVIEGDDAVYFTSEHLTWRWSKGAHVSVNATVRYFVDGRKLHVLDEDGKEHTIEIEKTIRKIPPSNVATVPPQIEAAQPQAVASPTAQVSVTVDSIPAGADIEIDGAFVAIHLRLFLCRREAITYLSRNVVSTSGKGI